LLQRYIQKELDWFNLFQLTAENINNNCLIDYLGMTYERMVA